MRETVDGANLKSIKGLDKNQPIIYNEGTKTIVDNRPFCDIK